MSDIAFPNRYGAGMPLRDWFAAHAPEPPFTWWGGSSKDCAGYALWNYQYADAMIAASKEGEKP